MQPPIILGLLWPNGSVLNQAFWQIYNQSYNAAVFFANKNKSSSVSQAEFIQSYVGSVAAALALGVGAVKLGDILVHPVMRQSAGFAGWYELHSVTRDPRAQASPDTSICCRSYHPTSHRTSSVGAGWASLALMRRDEMENGVNMIDDEGTVHGKSKIAAREGIGKCCIARVAWNIPATFLPPFAIDAYSRTAFNARNPRLRLGVQTLICTTGIALGLYPGQVTVPRLCVGALVLPACPFP